VSRMISSLLLPGVLGFALLSSAAHAQVPRTFASATVGDANGRTWLAVAAGSVQSFGDNYVVGNLDGDPAFPSAIARK